jgi:hypothetical protein
MSISSYFVQLQPGRIVLWCYFVWYLATVTLYFDPKPSIWLNALGISGIVGAALLLSVNSKPRADRWQAFRLFFMPFAVSSFSALIKNQGFLLVFAPSFRDLSVQLAACALFLIAAWMIRAFSPRAAVGGS